ncbi:MAG: crotonase/enoyl-CoA hydratase family protein [Polyangiaceae bacterium]|nr:crotonase/enoyl-CoA hydratase family protein [Polyangiaceae bacterium]
MSVRVHRDGDVEILTIDRPEVRNAVDGPTAARLADAFRAFERGDAKIAVLTGAGGTFCAGADLRGLGEGRGNRLAPDGDGPMGPSRAALSKPVIAAIEGHAVAGGLELALLCDLRIVAEDAVLGVFCRRWGVPLIDGGTARLPRIVGLGRALDLVLTGRAVGAAEAREMGLATRVVAKGAALDEAVATARHIASFPFECVLSDRASVYASLDLPLDEALRREFELGMTSAASDAMIEGVGRFVGGAGRGGV